MSVEYIESKVRKLISPHYARVYELKHRPDYKRLHGDFLRENYYLLSLKIHDTGFLNDWIIRELVLNSNDYLMVFDTQTLNVFKTFSSGIYKGINKELFDNVSKRVIRYDEFLDKPIETKTQYKVMVLGLLNARFKSAMFSNIGKNFPSGELILGFN